MSSVEFDHLIFEAIRTGTEVKPIAVWSILACVDLYQRVLLTREELGEGLARLIRAGRVAEAAQSTYFNSTGKSSSQVFSGLSEAAHDQGFDFYRRLAQEVADEDTDDL